MNMTEEERQNLLKRDNGKYSKDGAFQDPVVRCDGCHKLAKIETIKAVGCCPECGNKRVRNVLVFNSSELEQLKAWNIDPAFIDLFEPKPEGATA